MTVTVEQVTPEMARAWLRLLHKGARGVRGRVVTHYAREMSADRWTDNAYAGAIIFGQDGQLWDGKHRLLAIIESGCTVPLRIARNVDMTAPLIID